MNDHPASTAFFFAYLAILIVVIYLMVIEPLWQKIKGTKHFWIYGTCNNKKARKHSIDKNVQFILWKAGEQGHKVDCWVNFDSSWWKQFKNKDKE